MQSFIQRRRLGRFVQAEVEAQKKFLHWDSSTAKLEQRLNEDVAAESSHQEHASLRRVEDMIRSSSATLITMPEPAPKAKPPLTTNFADHLAERLEGVNPQDLDKKGRPQALLVEGSASDECSPRDWPMSRRLGNTVIIFLIVFVCGWASAANSSSQAPAAKELHASQESESLATALFLFGNAFGALLAGPISETAGRNPSYLIFMFLYMIMVSISALARNFVVQIVFRFLSGLFASPPLTIYGGSLADTYSNAERSAVWPIFAISPIAGKS